MVSSRPQKARMRAALQSYVQELIDPSVTERVCYRVGECLDVLFRDERKLRHEMAIAPFSHGRRHRTSAMSE